MMRILSLRGAAALLLVALAFCAGGCSDDVEPQGLFPEGNLPPSTEIVNPAVTGEEVTYNLLVSWRANDEDGTVVGFEVAIDDTSDWFFTPEYDSQFVFPSSNCCVPDTIIFPDGTILIDSLYSAFHTLFVRAVDNEGTRDPSPDFITFNSTTITPETVIQRGPSGTGSVQITATTVIVAWEGRDRDGVVAGYRYRLDDAPWSEVGADCTVVRFTNLTTAQFVGDTRGFHTFTVFAIDNAGAVERSIDRTLNFRLWESVEDIGGNLIITSNVLGSRSGVNTLEGQVFEGTRLSFDWRGDASLYGGLIQCYSYAYDDLVNFSPCDLRTTHFPPGQTDFEPPIGAHTLFVRAFDDAGQIIEANFEYSVLVGPGSIDSVNRRILYIDDFTLGTGSNGDTYPPDLKEEAFWDTLLFGFNSTRFDAEVETDIPTPRIIGSNSTLIWYIDDESQLKTSNQATNFRNPIGPYVNAGGNLIICGSFPSNSLTPDNFFDPIVIENPGCPHNPRNTFGGGDFSLHWFPAFCDSAETFVYDFFKTERSYYNGSSDYLRALISEGEVLPDGSVMPDLTIDIDKRGLLQNGDPIFGRLGLEQCEQYKLRVDMPGVIPLWRFKDSNGDLKRVCGFFIPASGTRGNIVVLGFSPYFFDTLEMQQVFRTFLKIFGENFSPSPAG
ncbi:MAG: hypothetical protein ACKVU1_02135 [bacterium]